MEETQLLKILAILGLLFGVYQFFKKRTYEKRDREREQKIKVLTDYLLKLSELRGVMHKTINQISKNNQILRNKSQKYKGQTVKIFKEENENNPELLASRFSEMELNTQAKFLEDSNRYFSEMEEFSEEAKSNLFELYAEIEEKGLAIKKEALISVHATTPIFKGHAKLIEHLDDFAGNCVGAEVEMLDMAKTYLKATRDITQESYKLEYNIVLEIKKTVIS